MKKKLKKYFVEFHYSNKVTGFVMAENETSARQKVRESGDNASFDDLEQYTQQSDLEIEFESCFEEKE